MRRNPQKNPHRDTPENQRRTEERVQQYYGKAALLATWETQPDSVQIDNHDYLVQLRRNVRQVRAYILHRAADVKI
jgi:hypothetical protein